MADFQPVFAAFGVKNRLPRAPTVNGVRAVFLFLARIFSGLSFRIGFSARFAALVGNGSAVAGFLFLFFVLLVSALRLFGFFRVFAARMAFLRLFAVRLFYLTLSARIGGGVPGRCRRRTARRRKSTAPRCTARKFFS